jgi:uncharacterized membrane protein
MSLCVIVAVLALGWSSPRDGEGPADKYEIVVPKDDKIEATGINGKGEVVGFEWAEEKDNPAIIEQVPFFAQGKKMTRLPLLKGYTATFPAAVSDDGLVVGRAGKPAPPGVRVHLRNQAFVWDAKNGIRGIGTLDGDTASIACGVSKNGRRVSGFSIGADRIRACVWDRDGDGDVWKPTALSQTPRLSSNVVAISDDGKSVTAIDGLSPCLWTLGDSGSWKREVIGEPGVLIPRAVNNAGMIVGVRYDGEGRTHAVIWSREGGHKQIEKPKGYERSEAFDVNNDGVVVGTVDGPHASKIGPNAFAYRNGKLRLLKEGGPIFTTATAINDNGQVTGVLEQDDEMPPEKPK